MSTQTDTIREALMEGSHVARIQALAALSELETQPKEGLSDEEIDRIASEHDQDELNDSRQDGYVTSADSHAFRLGIKCGLRYACDKGLLSPSVDVRGLEADNERLRAAGNEMCMLLCLFYKEAAVTMPETARKDLLAKINAWDAAAKEQCCTPTNTTEREADFRGHVRSCPQSVWSLEPGMMSTDACICGAPTSEGSATLAPTNTDGELD